MRTVLKSLPALALASAVAAAPAAAAPDPDPPKAASDAQAGQAGQDVVVTAKQATTDALHLAAPLVDLPLAVQVVPIETVEDQGFVRLGDAVRDVSGVVRKEAYFGLTDSFGIRGFDAATGLFNGFRHDYYGSVVDLAHVQAVEVIKGPASVTSGFLEPGGVVNVVAKRPTDAPVTALAVQGGSFDFGRAELDLGRRLSDALAVRLTAGAQTTASFRDYVHGTRWSLGATADWRPTPTTKVELSGYHTVTHALPDRAFNVDPVTFAIDPRRFLGEPTDSYRLRTSEASVVVTQQLGRGVALRSGFDWVRNSDLRRNTQILDLQPDGRTYARDYTIVPGSFDTKTAFGEVGARFATLGLGHRLTLGVDWTRQEQRYQFFDTDVNGAFVAPIDIFTPVYGAVPGAPASDGHFRGPTSDVGVYLNDLVTLGPVSLLLGLRHDHYVYHGRDLDYPESDVDLAQDADSPRVGIVYQPELLGAFGTLSFYANYAQSFDPQQYVRVASGVTPAPSRGKQVEAGVKLESADHRYTASLAAFRITKTNVATPDPADPTGTFSILSGADRSQGLELDVSARPVAGLKLLLAAAAMRAVVRSDTVLPVGDHLVNVPSRQATLTARYDLPRRRLGLGGSVYHVGSREAALPNTFLIPAYTRVDAALFYRLSRRAELQLNVQNLGDVRYYDSQDNSLFPGAPRSVLGTVRFRL